ncbi:MAG: tRNA epoxyqueuosine(34) reductase QueG [Anaerolineae bacterium]
MTLSEDIKEKAYELGFDVAGIAPAGRAPHADAYASWVDAGYAAAMGYLARDVARRQDPRRVLPGARSVVVTGLSYFVLDPPADLWADPARGRIARYAWGLDYHQVMTPRLHQLAGFIARQTRREVECRVYVDTGPVLERDFAAQAGLGFIGKNTCLINPMLGSYLFLGEILVNLELDYDQPATDAGATLEFEVAPGLATRPREARPTTATAPGKLSRRVGTCGDCVRCLRACPTQAFPAPYVLDSNRCISCLTIELKGSIPLELRPMLGHWIFGCDECQVVCPWPRRFSQPTRLDFLHFDPERAAPRLLDLIGLSEEAFRARFRRTPIWRARRRGLLRNVAVALGNWGDPQAVPALRKALDDPEPLIREHAAWALARISDAQ